MTDNKVTISTEPVPECDPRRYGSVRVIRIKSLLTIGIGHGIGFAILVATGASPKPMIFAWISQIIVLALVYACSYSCRVTRIERIE